MENDLDFFDDNIEEDFIPLFFGTNEDVPDQSSFHTEIDSNVEKLKKTANELSILNASIDTPTDFAPDSTGVIMAGHYGCTCNCLAPIEKLRIIGTVKPAPKSKPRVIKPKTNPLRRVTIEQAFETELQNRADEYGRLYFSKGEADTVALNVFARRVKISTAGRKSEGKTAARSPYAKLHDALNKAKWTRQVDGPLYCYYKQQWKPSIVAKKLYYIIFVNKAN